MDETAQDEWLATLSAAAALYGAMLAATVGGQLAGIGINALLRSHHLWIPVSCSVLVEALAGARGGAARQGRPLTPAESARLSTTYSLGLVCVSLPLGVWVIASRPSTSPPLDITWVRVLLGIAVAILSTGVRAALMVAFAPRRR